MLDPGAALCSHDQFSPLPPRSSSPHTPRPALSPQTLLPVLAAPQLPPICDMPVPVKQGLLCLLILLVAVGVVAVGCSAACERRPAGVPWWHFIPHQQAGSGRPGCPVGVPQCPCRRPCATRVTMSLWRSGTAQAILCPCQGCVPWFCAHARAVCPAPCLARGMQPSEPVCSLMGLSSMLRASSLLGCTLGAQLGHRLPGPTAFALFSSCCAVAQCTLAQCWDQPVPSSDSHSHVCTFCRQERSTTTLRVRYVSGAARCSRRARRCICKVSLGRALVPPIGQGSLPVPERHCHTRLSLPACPGCEPEGRPQHR